MKPFRSDEDAISHLIYHVLTPEESHAWFEVFMRKFEWLDESESSQKICFIARKKLSENSRSTLSEDIYHELMQEYFKVIDRQLNESQRLGWQVSVDRLSVALDTNGILTIREVGTSDALVRTAFLPGFGSSAGTKASHVKRDDPHARVSNRSWMRGDDPVRNKATPHKNVSQRKEERRPSTQIESLYTVFRRVVQFIRGWQGEHHSGIGIHSVKAILPNMRHLKFEHWIDLRTMKGDGNG